MTVEHTEIFYNKNSKCHLLKKKPFPLQKSTLAVNSVGRIQIARQMASGLK